MNKIRRLLTNYQNGKKISCITGYDASIAKYLEASQVDIILVGDSLGQVIKGEKSTHNVSLDEIIYHTSCVRSGITDTILMSDLPKNSYTTKLQAHKNSKKILSNNLADIVKLEIDTNNVEIAKYLADKKIPICAHIGLLPQSIYRKSGYRKYGKTKNEANKLFNLAMELDQAGVNIILLECIDNKLSKKISINSNSPVIGIGSGQGLDGQVAVIYDLLGISFNSIDQFTSGNTEIIDRQILKFKKTLR